jgi:two-component SAPR family response regulator
MAFPSNLLAGKKILVVEDEYLLAEDVCELLRECGAEIVGPVSRLEEGIALAESSESLDCAVLDLNLNGKSAVEIARTLSRNKVGFVFVTGYDAGGIDREFENTPRLVKPFDKTKLCHAVQAQIGSGGG